MIIGVSIKSGIYLTHDAPNNPLDFYSVRLIEVPFLLLLHFPPN